MSIKSSVSVLYDAEGNPVAVMQDGAIRALAVRDEEMLSVLHDIRKLLQKLVKHAEIVTDEEDMSHD